MPAAPNRRVEKGQATRRHLVDVATRLFARQGYEATSVDAVLQAAGVSRGALYHHFANKEALFEAVLEAVEADTAERLVLATGDATDPVDVLRQGCAAWLELVRDPVVQQISLIDAPAVVGWQRWREIDAEHGFGLLKEGLRAVAETGQIRADGVDLLAHMLLAALMELALLIAKADDPEAVSAGAGPVLDDLLQRLVQPSR